MISYEVPDEFKIIIRDNTGKIASFYSNERYFKDLIEEFEDKKFDNVDGLKMDQIDLVEEFASFLIKYEINQNQTAKSLLDIMKVYVIFNEKQEDIDTDSEDKDISDTNSENELKKDNSEDKSSNSSK